MKKRIVVYCDIINVVLKIIRALPLFVFHRKDWDILRPYVVWIFKTFFLKSFWKTMNEDEILELKTTGVFIAGFTDPSIKGRTDLYDVLVDGILKTKI